MPGNNQITFGVGFNVNESGLNKLKQSLQEIQKMTTKDFSIASGLKGQQAVQELNSIKASAAQVQMALAKAFNPTLGTTNITRFNQEMQKLNVPQIAAQFNQLGVSGQTAFLNIAKQSLSLNAPLKQNVGWLTKMGETLANTVKWNIASSAINALTGSISNAFNYVKALDSSLTDIRIVTGQSREEMAAFADQANVAAQALGRQTKEYTNAALAYYQQGLSAQEVQDRTIATLKAQNITGAGTEMTDYLTAVWNGYKATNDEIELYVDKLALVADSSASNLAELATGMSKVAATANNMGVTIDQLTAQLSTIIATTRQAPETVGNALKTIYARINDIKAGTDEADISLGNYTKKMASLGINVLDSNNELRATGEVMEEIGARWSNMTREQQVYLAQTMAGQRQMNNLLALFDNWTQYSEMLNVSLNAQGTLNEKNARYMESLSAHINQFKAALEGMQDALIDEESVMDLYDAGTKLVNVVESFVHSIGGMQGALALVGTIGVNVFKNQISESILAAINNFRSFNSEAKKAQEAQQIIQMFNPAAFSTTITKDSPDFTAAVGHIQQLSNAANEYRSVMTQANREVLNGLLEEQVQVDQLLLEYKDLIQQAIEYGNQGISFSNIYGDGQGGELLDFKDVFSDFDIANNKITENEEGLKRLRETVVYAREEYSSFAKQAAALGNLSRTYRDVKKSLDEQRAAVQNLEKEYEKYIDKAKSDPVVKAAQDQRAQQLEQERKKLEELEAEYSKVQTKIKEFTDAVKSAAESEQGFGENNERIIELLKQLEVPGNDNVKTFSALLAIFEAGEGDCNRFAEQLRKIIPELKELEQRGNNTKEGMNNFLNVLRDQAFAKSLTDMLRGVSSLMMGYQSLNSAVKTYKEIQEGTITATEGWTRILMSVSMGLPMVLSGVKALGGGILSLGKILGTVAVESAGAATGLKLVGLAASTAEMGISGVIAKLALAVPAILGVATVIWLIVKAVKAVYEQLNQGKIAYEKQKKVLEEATKASDELNNKYKELKDTIENYQAAQNAIKQLTKGTDEWKEAIEKANGEAKSLLEIWPELAGKVHIDSNGNIIIPDDALAAAQSQARRDAVVSDATVTQEKLDSAKANTNKAANEVSLLQQVPLAAMSRSLVEEYGPEFARFIGDTWSEIWEKALQEGNKGKKLIITKKAIDAVYQSINDQLNLIGDQELNRFELSLLQQFGDKIGPVIEAAIEEANVLQEFNKSLETDLLPVINETTSGSKNLVAVLMAAQLRIHAIDSKKGEINKENFETILKEADEFAEYADSIAKELNEKTIDGVVAFTQGLTDSSAFTFNELKQITDFIRENAKDLGLTEEEAKDINKESITKWGQAFTDIRDKIIIPSIKNAYDTLDLQSFASPDDAEKIASLLQKVFIKDYKNGLDLIQKIWDSSDNKEGLAKILPDLLSGMSFDELKTEFSEAGIDVSKFSTELQQLLNLFTNTKFESSFDRIAELYKEAAKVADGIEFGDGISADDAGKLAEFGINLEDFFITGANGEEILITKAEELRDAVDQIQMARLYNEMQATAEASTQLADRILNIFSDENLTQSSMYSTEMGPYDPSKGLINTDRASKQLDYINALQEYGLAEFSDADLAKWTEAVSNPNLINNVQATRDAYDSLAEAVENNLDKHEALAEIQHGLTEAFRNSQEALNSFRLRLDEDVDQETWQNLTEVIYEAADASTELGEQLSDDLKKDKIAAAEVAQAILRFDDAIQDVTDHYEDWTKALENGSLQDQAEVINELRDAYADLLDLDGDSLSDSFLQSAENLELMKQAAEGSEEAYNQLMANVQEDILSQVTVDLNDTDFWAKKTDVDTAMAEMNFENIEIGADLNIDNFLSALTDMVNAAGMSVDQATDYLSSMGIDAQVIEHSAPTTETHETGDVQAELVPVTGKMQVPVIEGTGLNWQTAMAELPYTVYGTSYKPVVSNFATTNENKAISLEVTSAHKSSGGGFKHSQAASGGGSRGGGTPKKSGGGGGGGSKPKTYTPLKPMKAKIDPYHDVNIKIGDTQEAIDKLQKERDKLIGKEAVKNLTKQIELMEQEKDLLKEKAGIAQGELQRQAQELANLGAIFNANGDIANYKDLLLNKQNQVNKAIEICNGLTGDEREAYEKYVKDLEQEYKDLEEAIKDFDETNQLLDDLGLDYQDIINKQIELAIEAFDLEINVKLDVKDAQREFNEFRKKIIDQVKDDQYGALATASARNYSQYYNIDENGNQGGIVLDLQRHAEAVQREAAKIQNGEWSGIYGNDLAAAADDLKKYNDELMKALEEAQDVIDETHQHFLDAIDAMDEAFDTQQENLDKLDDLLAHDMEILQLVHGEENFEEMNNLLEQQNQQDIKRLNALQKEQEYWQEKIDQYEEGTEEWEKAMANWQDAFEKTQDAMVQAIENVQKKWENSINSVMSKLRNQAYGGNMQSALEEWDKTTWHADRYLDSLERANGLLNLQNKYINAINNTNDPKIQEKLAQLEEHQLNSLSQKTHLREIDLKIAEQQLTVLQAQIALEEAQASKTKLRLRRDSQGNYNYQYVADEENIQDKILTYANELEEYRQMVKQTLRDDLDAMNEYTQEYFDKMAEAQMMFGDDSEALAERMKELAELYIGEDGYITRTATDAKDKQHELQEATLQEAGRLYDTLRDKGAGMYGVLTSGANGLTIALTNEGEALKQTLDEDFANIQDKTEEFYNNLTTASLKFLLGEGGDSDSILAMVDSLLNLNNGEIPDLLDMFLTDSFDPVLANMEEKSRDALFGVEGVFPEWGTAIADIAEKYEEEFLPTVSQAMEDLKEVHDEYKGKLDEIQEAVGRTFGDIALGLYFDTGYTNALNAATDALIQTQAAEVNAAEKVYDALKKNVDVFKESSAAAIQAANSLFLFWLALNGQTASGLPYSVEGFDTNIGVIQPSITSLPPPEPSYNPGYDDGGGSGSGSTGTTTAPQQQTKQQQKDRPVIQKTATGCFAPGTLISMADGSFKNIEDIQPNDDIIAYNENTKEFVNKKVIKAYVHHNASVLVELTFNNNIQLQLTPGHPLYSTNGWKSLDIDNSLYEHETITTLLALGDEIIGINGNSVLMQIKYLDIGLNYNVYTIEVEDCHTFLANGLVAHNSNINTKMRLATGGYTGEWDETPRLAWLDQKELVLNAEDTKNMLDTVKIVRGITDQVGAMTNAAATNFGGNSVMNALSSAGEQILQNVVINADFPAVQDAEQIKQAFNELVNLASQRASANRRVQ